MQIVITPTRPDVESFLLNVNKDDKLETVRVAVAGHLGAPAAAVRLVFEGVELPDSATVAGCLLRNLCTVRCVIVPGVGADATGPGGEAAAAASAPADGGASPVRAKSASGRPSGDDAADAPEAADASFVSAAEVKSSVVVTGLPASAPEAVHAALLDTFSGYGAIQRIVSQEDEPAEAGEEDEEDDTAALLGPTKHAVIVFAHEGPAVAALAYDRRHILGSKVRVCLASSLEPTGAEGGSLSDGVDVLSSWLATGLTLGRKGVANVQELSQRHGVTDAVKAAVSRVRALDERYEVSTSVHARVSSLSERYDVPQRATAAAQAVSSAASTAASRAMESSAVRRGVTAVSGAASRLGEVLGDLGTKTMAKAAEAREAKAEAAAPATGDDADA